MKGGKYRIGAERGVSLSGLIVVLIVLVLLALRGVYEFRDVLLAP